MAELDFDEQLKLRMWSGEYYHKGYPIVRLLAELAIGKPLDLIAERFITIDTDFRDDQP